MSALPQTEPGRPPLRLVPGAGTGGEKKRLTRASAWTVTSVVVMSVLRLGSQVSLSYLCLPEHFGAVALMRTFLTLVEMSSDMGIRGAVQYHARGEERSFLSTAFSVQLVRGLGMWLVTCAIAYPVASFYDEPLLLWLLPLAGFEAVSNGCLCVRVYVEERRLKKFSTRPRTRAPTTCATAKAVAAANRIAITSPSIAAPNLNTPALRAPW